MILEECCRSAFARMATMSSRGDRRGRRIFPVLFGSVEQAVAALSDGTAPKR
jgi:hypothetical protein